MKTAEFLELHTLEAQTEYIHQVAERFQGQQITAEDFIGLQHAWCMIMDRTELEKGEDNGIFGSKQKVKASAFSEETIEAYLSACRKGKADVKYIQKELCQTMVDEPEFYCPYFDYLSDRQIYYLNEYGHYKWLDEQREKARECLRMMQAVNRTGKCPNTKEQWETLCEAVRVDGILQEPKYPLTQVLMYDLPKEGSKSVTRRYRDLHRSLHGYLERNHLPNCYEDLLKEAETAMRGKLSTRQIDTSMKMIDDLPFDERAQYAAENGVLADPHNGVLNAMREAFLIDKKPSEQQPFYQERLFDRIYKASHMERPKEQVETPQNAMETQLEWFQVFQEYLDKEAKMAYPTCTRPLRYLGPKCLMLDEGAYQKYKDAREQSKLSDLKTALEQLEQSENSKAMSF